MENSTLSLLQKTEKTVALLSQKGWHISFAESCTGGKATAALVDVASASAVFDASFVTYANTAKMKYLGVAAELIDAHGVVSEQVALAMARGVAKETGVEVGVGISGIAGPSGGTAQKPVGTVCFGFYIDGDAFAVTCHFGNIGRTAVRDKSVEFVYDTLLQQLKQKNG